MLAAIRLNRGRATLPLTSRTRTVAGLPILPERRWFHKTVLAGEREGPIKAQQSGGPEALPYIFASSAARIFEYRQKNGTVQEDRGEPRQRVWGRLLMDGAPLAAVRT